MSGTADPWAEFRAPQGGDPWAEFRPQQAARRAETPAPQAAPLRMGESVAQGLGDPIHGGAQLLAHSLPNSVVQGVNDATAWVNRQPVVGPITRALGMVPATPQQLDQGVQQREAQYQAARRAGGETGMDWGRMAGNVATALPAAAALPAGSGLLGAAAVGGAANAGLAALEPVADPNANYWSAKKEQAEMGAAFGAAGGVAGRALGRMIAPDVAPGVRTLHEAGVELPPGQIIGGLARRAEDAATSIPIVGDAVRGAQRRSVESFNRATANMVLKPLGEAVDDVTPAGRELLADVGQRVSAAYDRAVATVRPFGPDQQFAQEVAQIGNRFLTPGSAQTFAKALQEHVVSRLQAGPIDGATYQTVKSELGRLAAEYRGSSTAAERELGTAFGKVQDAMRGLLTRANPDASEALGKADRAYSMLLRMENAGGRVGATEGVFTPAQLSGAVRQGDRSLNHRAYARGDALMQEFSDAGRAVMPSTVPDSGTPLRAMIGLGAGGAAGLLEPTTAAGAAGLLGLYAAPVSRAFQQAALLPRPMPLRVVGNTIASAPLAGAFTGGLLAP